MTLFELIFGPKNPTKDWQTANDLRLDFDLELGTLNGIGLTEQLDRLSFLGPVEERAGLMLKDGEFRFYSLGICIRCNIPAYTVNDFELIQNDPDSPQYRPYRGTCRYRGRVLRLNSITEQSFHKEFGPPFWRDQDDDEVILFYEFPNLEWQLEFSLAGTLNRIIVTADRLMDNEEDRKAYGVPDEWPPSM